MLASAIIMQVNGSGPTFRAAAGRPMHHTRDPSNLGLLYNVRCLMGTITRTIRSDEPQTIDTANTSTCPASWHSPAFVSNIQHCNPSTSAATPQSANHMSRRLLPVLALLAETAGACTRALTRPSPTIRGARTYGLTGCLLWGVYWSLRRACFSVVLESLLT